MSNAVLIAILVLFLVALFGSIAMLLVALLSGQLQRTRPGRTASQYRRAPSLLTSAEGQFYLALKQAVGPMAIIQCKVRLADVLLAADGDIRAFRQVSQKHVDFVLCDFRNFQPLVGIELDDRSHARPDRMRRDAFIDAAYASAGLPLVHIPVQAHYDPAQLLRLLQPHLHSR